MSKCIDAIPECFADTGWRARIARLFRWKTQAEAKPMDGGAVSKPPAPAPASLMMSRDIVPLVDRTAARLADWQHRAVGRRQLMGLDDRQLRDIGISRYDAEHEYRKPFWRA